MKIVTKNDWEVSRLVVAIQFDWESEKGIEGYPCIPDLGITIDSIDSWFIDSNDIEIEGY